MKYVLTIDNQNGCLQIDNNSKQHFLIVWRKPDPPRRNWKKIIIIYPMQFKIFDFQKDKIDIEKLSFSFEEVKNQPVS